MCHTYNVAFTNFQMTTPERLRIHVCKAQNVRNALENTKLNAGSTTCKLDIPKFVETLIVYSIFYKIGIVCHEFMPILIIYAKHNWYIYAQHYAKLRDCFILKR